MEENKSLVQDIFDNHYNFYKETGVDHIKSSAGHLSQVGSDYQGRVLYELLQNAVDRAESKIVVRVTENALFVANDGKKFTYNSNHDYKNGESNSEVFKRYDFQSLCSISTSNKTAVESIGNKGVGFKSVYALSPYANLHTKGIINPEAENLQETLSFRLYNVFDNLQDVPDEFDSSLQDHLKETICAVQKEYVDRGVPGYYYPLKLGNKYQTVFSDFDEEMVTVVEVPLNTFEAVNSLIDEIKEIHFNFIDLKYNKNIDILFETINDSFSKKTYNTKNELFSAVISEAKITPLAKKAGIPIKEATVGIKFKNKPNGLFYNYLPTKKPSPFSFVDFHADFHTTVDRKDINFDENNKIGAYNRALLKACIELYFQCLIGYIELRNDNCIKTNYVEAILTKPLNFRWEFIEAENGNEAFSIVRSILGIGDWEIGFAEDLFSQIALKYFTSQRTEDEHRSFFFAIEQFINTFTNDYRKQYSRSDQFKKVLFDRIKNINAQVIPKISYLNAKQLLYRGVDKDNFDLPENFPIKIFDFEIEDKVIRSALGIRDFSERNEVLRYFKQCSYQGDVSNNRLQELEQKKILESCYQLFLSKKEEHKNISNRYSTIYTVNARDKNSIKNQANFNVTTLFLKLENGKYKPAQLCLKAELDLQFIAFCNPDEQDNWLRYLGVATTSNYRVVDLNIYSQLKEGLDYIPSLMLKQEDRDSITGKLLSSVRVLTEKGELIHPAIINDNNYSFLRSIYNRKFKSELEILLSKKYDKFPQEYLDVLRETLTKHLVSHTQGIIKFYQNIFEVYANNNQYLVFEKGKLNWQADENFYVLGSKSDFEICTREFPNKSILVYYSGSSEMVNDIIHPEQGEISFSKKNLMTTLKSQLAERLPYILLKISNSNNSEVDYLSEDTDYSKLQERFAGLNIYKANDLKQKLTYGNLGIDNSPKAYAFNGTSVYLEKSYLNSNSIFTQAICEYVFNNTRITDQVELILFHKGLEELHKEVDTVELELINQRWKPDYLAKFEEFQTKILQKFDRKLDEDKSWYVYNVEHQSEFLISLDTTDRLEDLRKDIANLKKSYSGYFENFQLQINYDHINSKLARIEGYLEDNQENLNGEFKLKLEGLLDEGRHRKLNLDEKIEDLCKDYPDILKRTSDISGNISRLNEIQEIEQIYKVIRSGMVKNIKTDHVNVQSSAAQQIEVNYKKIIYNGSGTNVNGHDLEITGASGEIEVLSCLINDFLQLPAEERKKGIQLMNQELNEITGNQMFDIYAEECLNCCHNDEELSKKLISLMYVAKKYKYADFDLITCRNKEVVLVEVKTTTNDSNKNMYISIGEVNRARNRNNYEIVRVTPSSINFLGNPIKKVESKISEITTDSFTMTPRNYKLSLK